MSSGLALPTPIVSPTTATASSRICVPLTVTVTQCQPPSHLHVPISGSPPPSVTTQGAELLNWSDALNSSHKEGTIRSLSSVNSIGGDPAVEATLLEGACAIIMSLVFKGDHHWEVTYPRRCKSAAAKSNIQHTITGMMSSLQVAGLLSDEVATTVVIYLRRLSAKHVKYVSRFTIKKYICAACVVANKTCSDQYYGLDSYAAATGICKSVIVAAELQFLGTIEFNVQIGLASEPSSTQVDETAAYTSTSLLIHDMALAAAATSVTTEDKFEFSEEIGETCFEKKRVSIGIAAIVEAILSAVERKL